MVVSKWCEIGQITSLLGSKIPLRLTPRLLSLDLRRDNGMVDDMRAIYSIDGWHPVLDVSIYIVQPA